ncbi:hypothetical protein EGH21_22590 [Halomicroarcula sp. F13]|uniref:Major capsid protein n=1 Tax=Haloarcula rubra TaxID=2487747 RepID=A0AAW4PWY5_9EURY|nr:hypothetical protein [Halomicroarcula rubra]MBX0325810.1 hypothetical protein [Halomicroarcula rubra]
MSVGHINHGHSPRDLLEQQGMLDRAVEALSAISQEATYSTSDAALVNDLFGAALYVQTNLEANGYGSLPKIDRSGMNTDASQPLPLTFRAAHTPPALQSTGEGASIPDGRKYSQEEVSAAIKQSEAVVEQTHLQQVRAEILDGVPWDELTRVDELFQELAIDRDGVMAAVSANNGGYSSRDKITELDRIIASGDEEANATDTSSTAFADGDLDVYDIDRSADSWADAYVDHNSGTLRQLTESLMDSFLAQYFDFGSASRENVYILTGRTTAKVLGEIQSDSTDGVQAVVNYDPEDIGRDGVNDAETVMGLPTNTKSRHYKGIPIVPSQHIPADSLGRIYLIPTDTIQAGDGQQVPRIAVEELRNPHYEELTDANPENAPYLSRGKKENAAYYLMDHEIVTRDFSALGKLRDLQE